MIGHLGTRVSALLDGQLSPAEAEEAWAHVYACHACRDLVEREGWVKTRLAGLSGDAGPAPADLKGSLLSLTPGEQFLADDHRGPSGRRGLGAAALGGGAIGAAMVGVLALGLAPSSIPSNDRRPPASRVETPAVTNQQRTTPSAPAPAVVRPPAGSLSRQSQGAAPTVLPPWVERLVP
jgi:hypothetical protein